MDFVQQLQVTLILSLSAITFTSRTTLTSLFIMEFPRAPVTYAAAENGQVGDWSQPALPPEVRSLR